MRKKELTDLDHLFVKLAKGEMPDILEMMAALSDVSRIWPEVEPFCQSDSSCPFCD